MNRVNIDTGGPVMENLSRIEISDDFDTDTFYLDADDVTQAKNEGTLLELIAENVGNGQDILRAAIDNGSPVCLDGVNVDSSKMQTTFGRNAEGDMTARP